MWPMRELPRRPIFDAHSLRRGFLIHPSALLSILQNDAASVPIDDTPFLYFIKGAETPETSEIIGEAAISYARRLDGIVDATHED